jgi:alkylhydroperoxidase family enzyme
MARILYPDIASDPAVAALAQQIAAERGGRMLNLYRMLLHSPPFARGWLNFFTAVRQQGSLDARYRELAILRIAVLNRADYEFAQHVPFATKAGLGAAQIEAVKTDPGSPLFDARDRAVLAYAETMTRDIDVPDALFDEVRAQFGERDVVELTVTVAGYNLVSRFLVALQIEHD